MELFINGFAHWMWPFFSDGWSERRESGEGGGRVEKEEGDREGASGRARDRRGRHGKTVRRSDKRQRDTERQRRGEMGAALLARRRGC